jgi:hypothetical protein
VRKAILVVALIGASFGGGAAVNGPGLAWAQRFLTHQLGGDAPASGGENDLIAPTIDEIPSVADADTPGDPLPAAPLPPLATATAPDPSPVPVEPKAKAKVAPASPAATPTVAEPEPIDLDSAGPPLDGPDTATADDVPAPPAPAATGPADLELKDDAPEEIAWKDAPDSHAPARPIVPSGPSPTNPADPAVAAAGLSRSEAPSWSVMRQKLRDAGVSRYWIEGEPGGEVRLRCLIPVAGQRAVGQQFEGDGASEAQAAESVLRRITLWKATETP